MEICESSPNFTTVLKVLASILSLHFKYLKKNHGQNLYFLFVNLTNTGKQTVHSKLTTP